MKNLSKIRKARKMTQKELAEAVGVSYSAISQYESGKKTPSFEIALKLAEVLDCESSDLVSKRSFIPDILEDKRITATDGDGKMLDLSELSEDQILAIQDILRMNPQTLSVARSAIELFVSSQQTEDTP